MEHNARAVVVGFDGSESARAALEWAVAEARLHRDRLEVWIVLESSAQSGSVERGDEEAVLAELRTAIAGIVTDFATDTRIGRVGRGGAAAVLCEACTRRDLLVVGSRGRNPFAGLLLGSVSRACLHHARCSVAVVRPQATPSPVHGMVVVGIDTSGHSRNALHTAAQEAAARGAVLEAIHAVNWDHLGAEVLEPTTLQLITWGKDLVRTELSEVGVSASSVVVNGNPADVLVRHSSDADLLVLGSRGHNPLAALALGSTSDYCVQHAACPVLVVRPQEP